jgi:hypothetical protein
MTITCKRCHVPKHPVHFYPSDIERETHICRKCRQTYKGKRNGEGKAVWQNSNHRFFGRAVREADDQCRSELRSLRRVAGGR